MLVGTGLSFINPQLALPLTSKLRIIDLSLPLLSTNGCRQLLSNELLRQGLSALDAEQCLDNEPVLHTLCAGTMGIPGAMDQLVRAMADHHDQGYEMGRWAELIPSAR